VAPQLCVAEAGEVLRTIGEVSNAESLVATRVDRWLWAVRIYSTRSESTGACVGGHVEVNGKAAKAATPVRQGDRVSAFAHGRQRELEVVTIIEKRVGAPIAATCLVDHSPPPPPREEWVPPLFQRLPSTGRPTKKERRQLDAFRDRPDAT
jgi:ribosome-associated heat shock protein Hsp15